MSIQKSWKHCMCMYTTSSQLGLLCTPVLYNQPLLVITIIYKIYKRSWPLYNIHGMHYYILPYMAWIIYMHSDVQYRIICMHASIYTYTKHEITGYLTCQDIWLCHNRHHKHRHEVLHIATWYVFGSIVHNYNYIHALALLFYESSLNCSNHVHIIRHMVMSCSNCLPIGQLINFSNNFQALLQ